MALREVGQRTAPAFSFPYCRAECIVAFASSGRGHTDGASLGAQGGEPFGFEIDLDVVGCAREHGMHDKRF